MQISYFDIGVAIIIFLSGIFAVYRGAVREVLTILSWGGSLFLSMSMLSIFVPIVDAQFGPWRFNWLVTLVVTFLILLIVSSIVSMMIADKIHRSRGSALDRMLGFGFGLVRGLIIAGLAFLSLDWFLKGQPQPVWMEQSLTLPTVAVVADSLKSVLGMIPEHWISDVEKFLSAGGADAPG